MITASQQQALWRNPVPAGLCAILFFVLLGFIWPGAFLIALVIALVGDWLSLKKFKHDPT